MSGAFGWQNYAVSDGTAFGGLLPPVGIPPGVEPTAALSLFGITGLTAYFGLLDVGTPAQGETVVVSAAAGAVGSAVCQIAVLKGCRVVGIAGGPRKCEWVREQLGAHEVMSTNPKVCGIGSMRRVRTASTCSSTRSAAKCWTRSWTTLRAAPGNHVNLIVKRAVMRGFLVFEYLDRADEAIVELVRIGGVG